MASGSFEKPYDAGNVIGLHVKTATMVTPKRTPSKPPAPPKINPAEQIEWQAIETGYRLTLTEADTNRKQEIELDQALNIRKITHYNAAIFRALEITKNDWRLVGQIRLPYEIIIKRFVPRPNHLIMRFKEIRPNETLGAAILDHQFPSDVTYVELTERM